MKRKRVSFLVIITFVIGIVFSTINGIKIQAEEVNMEDVYTKWINYPDESFGYGYQAGWNYNPTKGLNTSQNVGWTGFYNPNITDYSTGTFEFTLQSNDHDPLGFTWGMVNNGTVDNPDYSFYAFEECGEGYWTVAYISSWRPKENVGEHQGPLYHGAIDARDGQYNHDAGTKKGNVGFADGTILYTSTLPTTIGTPKNEHKVKLEVENDNIKVYFNNTLEKEIAAPVQNGSFGPFATSNAYASIKQLSFYTTSTDFLEAKFEFRDKNNAIITQIQVGEEFNVVNLSTYKNSPIILEQWIVKKDGVEIYRGNTPFLDYNKAAGLYETSLQVINDNGIQSLEYISQLKVIDTIISAPSTKPSKNEGPKTGDNAILYTYILLSFISLLTIYKIKKEA